MYNKIINKIKEYDTIVIYRHVNPDFDAFGSQLGLYFALKATYPTKNIVVTGEFSSDLLKHYEDGFDTVLPDFNQDVLAIITDTANHERIDGDSYQQCKETIKIDHHIVVDSYGTINLEDASASSCCQMIGHLFKETQDQWELPMSSLRAVYLGIIGDSNRFMYRGTGVQTFEVAAFLVSKGVDIESIYNKMYTRKEADLKIQAYILNKYKSKGSVAYYILEQTDLDALGITRERGSDFVNMLSGIEEYKVWIAVTQNIADDNWRVSIRSRGIQINDIAGQYNGGGHMFASGAKLESIDQIDELLEKLEERIHG